MESEFRKNEKIANIERLITLKYCHNDSAF